MSNFDLQLYVVETSLMHRAADRAVELNRLIDALDDYETEACACSVHRGRNSFRRVDAEISPREGAPLMLPVVLGAMMAMQVVGGMMQKSQADAAGSAAKATAKFKARLAENRAIAMQQQAGQTRAAAQRAVYGERQQGALIPGSRPRPCGRQRC